MRMICISVWWWTSKTRRCLIPAFLKGISMHTPPKRTLTVAAMLSVFGLALSACSSGSGDDDAAANATATVVATTTQVGSVAGQVTECADGHTQVLMSPGDDPHQFEASSAQIADMISADLVVTNGL